MKANYLERFMMVVFSEKKIINALGVCALIIALCFIAAGCAMIFPASAY